MTCVKGFGGEKSKKKSIELNSACTHLSVFMRSVFLTDNNGIQLHSCLFYCDKTTAYLKWTVDYYLLIITGCFYVYQEVRLNSRITIITNPMLHCTVIDFCMAFAKMSHDGAAECAGTDTSRSTEAERSRNSLS